MRPPLLSSLYAAEISVQISLASPNYIIKAARRLVSAKLASMSYTLTCSSGSKTVLVRRPTSWRHEWRPYTVTTKPTTDGSASPCATQGAMGAFFGGNVTAEQAKTRARKLSAISRRRLPQAVAGVIRRGSRGVRRGAQPRRGRHSICAPGRSRKPKKGRKAYVYYFTQRASSRRARGASHTVEISYMYGNPAGMRSGPMRTRSSPDAMMTSYWANFIATGDPNGKRRLRSGTRTPT